MNSSLTYDRNAPVIKPFVFGQQPGVLPPVVDLASLGIQQPPRLDAAAAAGAPSLAGDVPRNELGDPMNGGKAQRRNELGAALPALDADDSAGDDAAKTPSAAPAVVPPAKGTLAGDQAELARVQSTGSGISQIKNPFLRTLATVGDAVGSAVAPALTIALPGTAYHHAVVLGQARKAVQGDEQDLQSQAQLGETQARTRLVNDQAKAAEAPATPDYDYVDTPQGKVAIQKGTTTAQPVTLNGQPITAPAKPPANAFELWLKQNPNGTAKDYAALQAKPLSAAEAASLNAVWDGIASKHHLPTGQFTEGMPHSDATTLAGALNNAIGKQQGDTHVSISLQGLKDNESKTAANNSVDMSDPQTAAAVAAVANGSMRLQDVFGRGATTAQKAQFAAAVKQINPEFNSGDHDVENASRKYFIVGQGGQSLNSMQTANHHLDLLDQAGAALKNGDVKTLNAIGNELGVQMGSDAKTNFNLILSGVATEVARAYKGAAPEQGEINDFRKQLSGDGSPQQIHGGVSTVRGMLGGKMKSLQDQAAAGARGQANFGGGTSAPTVPSGKIIVTAPDGSKHPFDNQAQADTFKKLAHIQ
jgi:hypothetical protein